MPDSDSPLLEPADENDDSVESESPGPSKFLKRTVIVVGVIFGLPTCCCLGILGVSMIPRGDEVAISNPRGGLGSVQVDYKFNGAPDRRMRYFLVVETADGQRVEWMAHGDLQESGTFSTQFAPGRPANLKRPLKIHMAADGPARKQEGISNTLELP